jgi:lysophospholipase L1-like esterase
MPFAVGLAAATLLLAACTSVDGPVSGPGSSEGAVTDPNAPLAAFYGDSYTLGTGASDPANRWSSVICRDRGWREFNPSANGLGFVNNRRAHPDLPSLVIEQDPDIVFVTMGLNDNFAYHSAPDDIHEAIDADLRRLKTELPNARFIVVEPFWYTDERPDSVEVIIGWVHDAADAIDADWVPGASHWLEGHPEWMAADGLHPNDEGYAEMARQMDAALAELGL